MLVTHESRNSGEVEEAPGLAPLPLACADSHSQHWNDETIGLLPLWSVQDVADLQEHLSAQWPAQICIPKLTSTPPMCPLTIEKVQMQPCPTRPVPSPAG